MKATCSTSLRFQPWYPGINRQIWDWAKQTFQIQFNTKAVNQKDILWRSSHTLCFALYSISLHYMAFLGKNLSQENMLCFWSIDEIPITNAMTNVSGKINIFFQWTLRWEPVHPLSRLSYYCRHLYTLANLMETNDNEIEPKWILSTSEPSHGAVPQKMMTVY